MAYKGGDCNSECGHWGYANKYLRNPSRCKKCGLVFAFIEEDGICGSPKCRSDLR